MILETLTNFIGIHCVFFFIVRLHQWNSIDETPSKECKIKDKEPTKRKKRIFKQSSSLPIDFFGIVHSRTIECVKNGMR